MRRHASWQFGQLALGWRSRSKFADLFESTLLHSTADLIDFPLPRDAEIRPVGHVRHPAVPAPAACGGSRGRLHPIL